jgi:hypothetical protein
MVRVWSRTLKRRTDVLGHGRQLARTGRFANHRAIVAELRQLPDSRLVEDRWFDDPMFLEQLDLLCAKARRTKKMTIDSKGRKRPRDPNQLAKFIVDKTAENEREFPPLKPAKPSEPASQDRAGDGQSSPGSTNRSRRSGS